MQEIVFVNNSKSLNGHEIKSYVRNPGIGGTEYVTLKLIYDLNLSSRDMLISIATDQDLSFDASISRIKKYNLNTEIKDAVIVCPVSQIDYLLRLQVTNCRYILWSHHPHDKLPKLNFKDFEVVSLGEYQFRSNSRLNKRQYLIRNPSPQPAYTKALPRIDMPRPENFVYMGAMGPAKGLHLVLRMWPAIRARFNSSKLNIIGGDLYQERDLGSYKGLPISGPYAEKLHNELSKMNEIDREAINFLGLLSCDKMDEVLRDSDVALLNPTGKSEAAPASPLECYAYGIPVIAGGDFGAFDNMKYFPRLDLIKNNIDHIINSLDDKRVYRELRVEALEFSKKLHAENQEHLKNWVDLFNNRLPSTTPSLPKYIRRRIRVRSIFDLIIKRPIKKIIAMWI